MAQAQASNNGPPYIPTAIAMVGGHPTPSLDVPICAVFLALYVLGAIGNMAIFQINRRHGHKFLMSWAMFGFCMARNATFVLRIVWAYRLDNASLIIAAQIFSAAGVLIAYIVLLLLSLRLLRATHPELGWNPNLRKACKALYILLFIAFVLTISFTIESFYTLNPKTKNVALWVQRSSSLVMLLFNMVSLIILSLSIFLPRTSPPENFGTGSLKTKTILLSTMMFFVLFIIGFRFGTAWTSPRPAAQPAWFDSKPAFYIIEFAFEIVVIYMLLLTRFDRMFWVPNGSAKAGDYQMWNGTQKNEGERLASSGEDSVLQLKTYNSTSAR
ncbi:hypothetical protein BKA65DRAFT_501576 [Rhexocercosporidium sp. MPI-PUGE-AT-0058]|nr:hypothetical protein BKA65DRAFT_501576 [Rhexocercosporidium sp. MPI-PUGE-AT-0058]